MGKVLNCGPETKKITTEVEVPLWDKLRAIAKSKGMWLRYVVREALLAYVAAHEAEAGKKVKQ